MLIALGVVGVVKVADSILDARQRKIYKTPNQPVPECYRDVISPEKLESSRLYALDRSNFAKYSGIFGLVKELGFMLCFVTPLMLVWSDELLMKYCPRFLRRFLVGDLGKEIFLTNLFLIISGLLDSIISLPFDIYNQFVIEEKHGFNKMTYKFYAIDTLKKMAVGWAIQLPITALLIWAIRKSGDYLVPICWATVSVITLVMLIVYPTYIMPLFDTYTLVEEGELRDAVYALAEKCKYPLHKLYTVDGSTRSGHSNAYLTGFGKFKRIVLFDTLIHGYKLKDDKINEKGCNLQEICAVLGHEIGHWHHSHVIKMLTISEISFFIYFYGFSLVKDNAEIFSHFGFSSEVAPPSLIQFTVFVSLFLTPVHEIIGTIATLLSRKHETEADTFSFSCNPEYGPLLKSALKKLTLDNSSFPIYDKYYSWRHHSHPPVDERCKHIDQLIAESKKDL